MALDMKTISIDEWNELQQELQSLRAEKLSYDSIADGLSTELEGLRGQIQQKETNCQSYSMSNTQLRTAHAELNKKYEQILIEKSGAVSTIAELKSQICNVQNENKNVKKQNHRLQIQNDEFTEELSDSNNKLFSIQQKYNTLLKEKNEVNAEKRQIETNRQCLEIELNSYKSQISIFSEQIKSYQHELTTLKKEHNESMSDQSIEMDQYKRDIDALQREIKTTTQMMQSRDETIASKIKDIDHLQNTMNETRMNLEHQVLSLNQQIASFRSQNSAEQRRREIIEGEKEKLLVEQQTLNANMIKFKNKIHSLQHQNKTLHRRLNDIKYDPTQWDIDTAKLNHQRKTPSKVRRYSMNSNNTNSSRIGCNISQIEGRGMTDRYETNAFDVDGEDDDDYHGYSPGNSAINDGMYIDTPSGGDELFKLKFIKLSETVRVLYGQNASLKDENDELQRLLDIQIPTLQNQKLAYKQMKQTNETMSKEVEEMEYKLNALQEMHHKQTLQYNDLRKKFAKALHERDELNRNVVQNLYDRAVSGNIHNVSQSDAFSAKYMQFGSIQQLVYKQQELTSQLREQTQELEAYKSRVDKATATFKDLHEANQFVEDEKKRIQKQLEQMTEKIRVLEGNKSKEEEDNRMHDMSMNIKEEEDVLEWKQYAQEREKEHDLYRETKQKQIESLQENTIKLNNENQMIQVKLHELNKNMDEINRNNIDLQQRIKQKEEEMNAFTVHSGTWSADKKRYLEQINNYKNAIVELNHRIQCINQEKISFNEQIMSFKHIISNLQSNIAQLTVKQIETDSSNNEEHISLMEFKSILEQHKDKDLQFLNKQNELNKEINGLMVSNSNLKKDINTMERDVEQKTICLDAYDTRYNALDHKYNILNDKYNELGKNKNNEFDAIGAQFKQFMEQSVIHQQQTSQHIQQFTLDNNAKQSSQVIESVNKLEMEELQNEMETKQQQLDAIQSELKAMEQQFNFWKNKAIDYENEVKSAEKQCKELSEIFDRNLSDKDTSNVNLQKELKQTETELGSLRRNLAKINEQFVEKDKESVWLKEEIVRLKENELKLQNRLETVIKDKNEAQNNYQEELEEHANALQDIEVKNGALMSLKEELLEKDRQIAYYKLEIVKTTSKYKQKEIGLTKRERDINEKNTLLLEEQRTLTQQIRLITQENDRLKMDASSTMLGNVDCMDSIDDNDNEEIRKLKKYLSDHVQTLARYKERLSSVNNTLQEVELEKEKLAQQNTNNNQQIVFYKCELEKQLKNTEQHSPTKSQQFISELQNVSAIYQSNKLLKDGLKQRDERINKLENEQNEYTIEIHRMKETLHGLNGDKAVLQHSYDQVKKELDIMRENHQSMVTKYHKIDPKEYQRLLSIEEVKNQLQTELNKTSNRYQGLLKQSKDVLNQNKALSIKVQGLTAKMQASNTKMQKLNTKYQSVSTEIQSLKQKVKGLEMSKLKAEQEKANAERIKSKAEQEVRKHSNLLEKLKSINGVMHSHIKEKDKTIKEQRETMHDLTQKYSQNIMIHNKSNDPKIEILMKRMSVLSNLLQQKKAIITKLMNNNEKQEIGELKKQISSKERLLNVAKEKVQLQESEIGALHTINNAHAIKIKKLEHVLKHKPQQEQKELQPILPQIEKQKSMTRSISPQAMPLISSKLNVQKKISKSVSPAPLTQVKNRNNRNAQTVPIMQKKKLVGQKRKRNVMEDDHNTNNTNNSNDQNERHNINIGTLEPPVKRSKTMETSDNLITTQPSVQIVDKEEKEDKNIEDTAQDIDSSVMSAPPLTPPLLEATVDDRDNEDEDEDDENDLDVDDDSDESDEEEEVTTEDDSDEDEDTDDAEADYEDDDDDGVGVVDLCSDSDDD